MELLLWAERRKLRRSKILWIAGFATVMVALIVFAQGQFTFYESRYIDGAGWFMTAAQSLATFYVLPAVIALLGSYMICREEQEDTLKSLRLIPVDEVKLTLSKMVLALVFSVVIYLLLFAITFLVEAVLHFEALSIGLVLGNLKTYLLDGIGVFFAIGLYKVRKPGSLLIMALMMGLIQLMMSPPMFLSSVLNGVLIELIVLLLFRGYEKDAAVFVAAMLHTPLSLPFNYLYNRLVKGTDSPLAAVADRAPLAAVGMTLAVVAVSALGALIGIKIARELKKSGVLKK